LLRDETLNPGFRTGSLDATLSEVRPHFAAIRNLFVTSAKGKAWMAILPAR
jgi:hypothetical protein